MPPVVRVAEHVAEEADVVLVDRAEHQSPRAPARAGSGCRRGRRRRGGASRPCSSKTIPTSTPASRSRSASAFRSATSTCATPRPRSARPRRGRSPSRRAAACDQRSSKSTASLLEAERRRGRSAAPRRGRGRGTRPSGAIASRARAPGSSRNALSVLQELGAGRAVDGAMVARERHRHHRQHEQLAVARDDLVSRRADGEDRRLRRVEHGDELVDVVHAEVRDRERAALEILARAACRRGRGRRGRRARRRSARSTAARRRGRPARRGPAAPRRRCRRWRSGRRGSRPR